MSDQTTIANLVAKLSLDTANFQKGTQNTDGLFSKLTSSIVKANVATKALGMAFSGVTKLIGSAAGAGKKLIDDSTKAFAEFQQLSGGTELMFGEAFQWVEDRASEAYKNLGMSKNDYLQQVNGLATGLKTALGGNEQAAAELADRVLTAEADVVAATGNSQEAVQNAFNGIMKSNYTMLDNLQLGIKPTKEGFQELIDTVNKWNAANGEATNYRIDNLADAQSALVDYIEMQGLAGYAANEAADTIEGSAASMKAAWENAKLALAGGEDIGIAFANLGDTLVNFLANMGPKIGETMANIGDSLSSVIPVIGDKMIAVIPDIVPKFVAGGIKLIVGLVKGIGVGAKTLWAMLKAIWQQVQELFKGFDLKQVGVNLITALWDGVKIGWNKFVAWIEEKIGDLLASIEAFLNEKIQSLAKLPIIRDLFPGIANTTISLGSEAMKKSAAGHRGQADRLQSEQAALMAGVRSDLAEFETDLLDRCDLILGGEGSIENTNKTGLKGVEDAVNGLQPEAGGASAYTAEDQLEDMMQRWYEEYASGTYDYDLLEAMNGVVRQLNQMGVNITTADIINSGVIPEDARVAARRIAGDPEYATAAEQQNTTSAVSGVEEAVEGQDLSVDMSPVTDAIDGLGETFDPEINITTPEAKVTVDTSVLDASASALSTAGTELGDSGAAGALTTAAGSLAGATNPYGVPSLPQNDAEALDFLNRMLNGELTSEESLALSISQSRQEYDSLSGAQQPIPEDTVNSWYSLRDAMNAVKTVLTGGEEGAALFPGEDSGGLNGALGSLKSGLENALSNSTALANYFKEDFVAASETLRDALCKTSVNEEGEVDASGGNTLYTALGSIKGLLEDIYTDSENIVKHWTGAFPSGIETLKEHVGYGIDSLETMKTSVTGLKDQFSELTGAIEIALAAFEEFMEATEGKLPGGGSLLGKPEVEKRAKGGPVVPGKPYLVGEDGPELRVFSRSGYIVPHDELEEHGQAVVINFNGDVIGDERSIYSLVNRAVKAGIRQEVRSAV